MKRMSVLTAETGKRILPGGYVINAAVLVRTPEDEKTVLSSIRKSLDKRFRITLLSVVDPADLGLNTDKLTDYFQIKEYQSQSVKELRSIARKLRSTGYEALPRVEIGTFNDVVEEEAKSERNDVIVLLRRKTVKGRVEKQREDSALAVLSKYPGKLMIVRRTD
jgi:hypothetical protein